MAGGNVLPQVKPGWQAAVADVFLDRLGAPFRWGSNDCCLFAADCIKAATGVDVAEDVRGKYCDTITAYRLIDSFGGLESIAAARCGSEINPGQAVFGDIGLVENHGRPCLSVFGGQFFHAPAEHGLTIIPIEACTKAWRLTD
jgi:hypothetical protein